MELSNKRYDQLKFFTTVLLPALGTLYFALSGFWGLPKAEEILGTITALVTFLSLMLRSLSKSYEEPTSGVVQVKGDDENGMPQLGMVIQEHPDEMLDRGFIRMKVDDIREQ